MTADTCSLTVLAACWALALSACGGSTDDGDPAEGLDEGPAAVETTWAAVTSFELTRVAEDGTVPGFDLDNRLSGGDDEETCFYGDKSDAQGRHGIDNQMAELTPILEALVGGAVEGLIQGSVNEGRLLLLLELTVDPPRLSIRRGDGKPYLGTDGMILDGQTFVLAKEEPLAQTDDVTITQDGGFEAKIDALVLPVSILREEFDLDMRDVQVRLAHSEDGGWEGLLGGGFPIETMVEVAYRASENDGRNFEGPLRTLADMNRDETGTCTRMSSALALRAVPAYVFGDPGPAAESNDQ